MPSPRSNTRRSRGARRAAWRTRCTSGGAGSRCRTRAGSARKTVGAVVANDPWRAPATNSIRGPALPKARQWLVWLAYHAERLPAEHGWPAACRDVLVGLHHGVATAARRL